MVGASLTNPNKLFFGVFGDLAFFYDMNVLGNRHVGNNIRLLLINNGKGNEFRLYCNPCIIFGEDAEPFMAASGHYGNKSGQLVKHYAEDLGFDYLCASTKEEFIKNMALFIQLKTNKPIVFEVFTDTDSESNALKAIRSIKTDAVFTIKKKMTNAIKDVLGNSGVQTIKDIIGK